MTDVTRAEIEQAVWQHCRDRETINAIAESVWNLIQPDPARVLAVELELAARATLTATTNLLASSLGIPTLDVNEWLAEIDWQQVARDQMAAR